MLKEEEKDHIEGLKEHMLYFTIDGIGGMIWRTNHDASHGRYDITPKMQEELEHLSEYQQLCVQQLSKFGVDPESAKNRPDGDYWKWYKHWGDWKNNMTNEEWRNFDRKLTNQEDVTDLLPKEPWNKTV